jgi:hypothetical protein
MLLHYRNSPLCCSDDGMHKYRIAGGSGAGSETRQDVIWHCDRSDPQKVLIQRLSTVNSLCADFVAPAGFRIVGKKSPNYSLLLKQCQDCRFEEENVGRVIDST